MTPAQLLKYDGRRRKIAARVEALGTGTRQKLSYFLKIPASQVSNVLSGKYVHPPTMDRLEGHLVTLESQAKPTAV